MRSVKISRIPKQKIVYALSKALTAFRTCIGTPHSNSYRARNHRTPHYATKKKSHSNILGVAVVAYAKYFI